MITNTHQEVGGLDVTVNQVMRVDIFDARDLGVFNQYSALQSL
jgi:hypothetical protein